ncbi:BTAD domain-containing putative transcriptional regulator [Streptomyces tsukubensis]|uniref:BTAD domain-containing putative transcriptional regulator n=1 Tax=Streptomyces tsukubensis TaxID=83656 RepID=UPI00344C18E4
MRFGVLGPLTVWAADGRTVSVPELKVRTLLACLLAHRGRPVSADRLIAELWGERPPARPAAALQNKVWQLRRALEAAAPGARDLVVSRAPGYELRTAPGSVDADRFGQLAARARTAAGPHERAALLADALAQWRGPAFADFADEEFARRAAAGLEEQRLTALEEQAETRLELGEHALVADELGDLVAAHPLRERLGTARMRALYLAGRQADALHGFTDLRQRLADELGVDPGPEPTAVYRAILAQDAPPAAVPPPATTVARPPTNIPGPGAADGLIGRDPDVAALRSDLLRHRLVTLIGPGGVGKTQLALAVAAAAAAAGFPGGVRLVELAALPPARDRRGTGPAELIAGVLGVRDDIAPPPRTAAGPRSLTDRIVQALGEGPALLVLDNCEHVVDAVAELVAALLAAAPGLTVLATGQVPLQVRGERLHEVLPLAETDAVALFTARARASAPQIPVDGEENAATVAAICRRLDGLPLALEMAATRVRVLGVAELAARLDDRFQVLASGLRDAPARQRTLRAVIDWSWDLLGERERTVLRRLAVHACGCGLDAAETLCPADGVDRSEVLDLLARLVDASLVVVTDTPEGPRYRLLESVSAYALEQLRDRGELEALRVAHRDYYTGFAERAEPQLRGHEQRRWLRLLDTEDANLRAALDSAAEAGDTDRSLRLVNALTWYWRLRGRYEEAARRLGAALSLPGARSGAAGPREHARLTAGATARLGGMKLALGGTQDPAAEYRTALSSYEGVADPAGLAWSRWYLSTQLYGVADSGPGEELLKLALAGFESLGDRWGTAAALAGLAFRAKLRGDFTGVRDYGERSLALFRELGDTWGQLQSMIALQTRAEALGRYTVAGRLHREALRMAEDLGLWPEVSYQLSGLGRIALLTGEPARAREFHERARRLSAEQADVFGELYAETGLALGARREGRPDAAEEHWERVLELQVRMGYEPAAPPLVLAELGFVAEARGRVKEALRLQHEGLAAARATGDPRALALALEGLAGAELLSGDAARAAGLLGAAAGARESVGVPLPAGERGDVDRIGAGARGVLGAVGYEEEFARGRERGPEAVAAVSAEGAGAGVRGGGPVPGGLLDPSHY